MAAEIFGFGIAETLCKSKLLNGAVLKYVLAYIMTTAILAG